MLQRYLTNGFAVAAALGALSATSDADAFFWEHTCVNNGCLQLATHIRTSSIPWGGSFLVMGAMDILGTKVVAFCSDNGLVDARTPSGARIVLGAGATLRSDLSLCGTSNADALYVLPHDTQSFSCLGQQMFAIQQNGYDLAISTGRAPVGTEDFIDVNTGAGNGATYLCGGDGKQYFEASEAAFPLMWGFGSNDTLIANSVEGGWLFGGNDNDLLKGASSPGTSLCYGENGFDNCPSCDYQSTCELSR